MMRGGWLLLGCLLAVSASAEEKLGRLFFTPAQRADLDYLRQTSQTPQVVASEQDEDASSLKSLSAIVSVGGYVKRSDGKNTAWVNGHPLTERGATKDIALGKLRKDSNQVPLKLQNTGQKIELKPGQVYDPASDKVVNSFEYSAAGK